MACPHPHVELRVELHQWIARHQLEDHCVGPMPNDQDQPHAMCHHESPQTGRGAFTSDEAGLAMALDWAVLAITARFDPVMGVPGTRLT